MVSGANKIDQFLSNHQGDQFKEKAIKKISKIFDKISVSKNVVRILNSENCLHNDLEEDLKPLLPLAL
jgi:hypothetical protein